MQKSRINQELDNKKHLSPRQIINRYKKGEYVDESIEAISSTISSCPCSFDSVAVPFQSTIVDKVLENISIAQTLYELQKNGESTESTDVPDYPQLKNILLDLSYPPLWESLQDGNLHLAYMDRMHDRNLYNKYLLETGAKYSFNVVNVSLVIHRKDVERAGLSPIYLSSVLNHIFKTLSG